MDYSKYAENHLDVVIKDRIALVTMNRPERRNAVDGPLHDGLEMIFRDLGTDPDVGAIVLTGAGTAFCAGGDFSPGSAGASGPSTFNILRGAKFLIQGFANCEAPLIAAVNGPAAGLGASVALMCDVIYMADTAWIGDTHVNLGLVAGDGGAVIWPLLIGPNRAKEYLMSGKRVSAEEAERIGLVNHVVPADKLLEEAIGFAKTLAAGPAAAVRWTKMAINRHVWQSINLVLEMSLSTEGLSTHTLDHKEAVQAFQEKRDPKFTGQ